MQKVAMAEATTTMEQHNSNEPSQERRREQDPSFLLDALYCEEDRFEEEDDGDEEGSVIIHGKGSPLLLTSHPEEEDPDMFWEDEELLSLFSKEEEQRRRRQQQEGRAETCFPGGDEDGGYALEARRRAVEWVLRVKAHYDFSALTAVLAIEYLDRFLASFHLQRDKPWMIQLVAVACLSLSAKVEETQVPLLLDLQVGDAKYVFETKTIQRMELLVLSTLQWRMHPVTPLSFLDHIVRRLVAGTRRQDDARRRQFLRRCERLIISLVADSRSRCYLPSVLATATMMHVTEEMEPFRSSQYNHQLLDVLNMNKDNVEGCCRLIQDILGSHRNECSDSARRKRKSGDDHDDDRLISPRSPSGVIDASLSFGCCSDGSNDSWAVDLPPLLSSCHRNNDDDDGSAEDHQPQTKRSRSLEEHSTNHHHPHHQHYKTLYLAIGVPLGLC